MAFTLLGDRQGVGRALTVTPDAARKMRQERWRDTLKRQSEGPKDTTHRESLLTLEMGVQSVASELRTDPCPCCLTCASRVCGEGG